MSALDSGTLGSRAVTDLDEIAKARREYLAIGYQLPLQDAERDAGLTEADVQDAKRTGR
ncbi:hypothetical protein M2272_005141 [Mycobacterium frederiksbergense]|uniref:Uncharacterized protein n=1 Tax=Mycolicibacterium frederiksbergense TaxID=117567 RepID=A0ABT6L8C2_9MYCO|nr:hypothetical protein [Mycolicibacterium frederiksbergense]MDH6198482.1 hypothetical protein [Mycolicibacterium frederiksbergense]